ncbi:MAG: Gx transporter family protein [Candidatus Omnitrophica bacterium]|nr:Gx transporter family protein [Candidatus Omnitrophota bacterium]
MNARQKIDFSSKKISQMAFFIAIACVLQISESLIPHPIPGLRLGLANTITIIVLFNFGFKYALELSILRTIVSSFFLGTFLSPSFLLSFIAAVLSTLIMGILYHLSLKRWHQKLGIIGISIIGALFHNIIQLFAAYFLLVKHPGIFVFFPWLCLGSLVTGWITGVVAANICRNFKDLDFREFSELEFSNTSSSNETKLLQKKAFLMNLSPGLKIAAMLLISCLILVSSNYRLNLGICLLLIIVSLFSRISLAQTLIMIRRLLPLLLPGVFLHLFFNSGTSKLFSFSIFTFTREGLHDGLVFSLRMLTIIIASSILLKTTSHDEMNRGLGNLLWPLKFLGISQKRTAATIALSLQMIPLLGERFKSIFKTISLKNKKSIKGIVSLLTLSITTMFIKPKKENN